MKNKILLLAAATIVLTLALDRALIKPVLADVRSILVQNIDEPARNPFSFSASTTFPGAGTYSFYVPAGQRYVVQAFTADCDVVDTTTMTDIRLLGYSGGVSSEVTTAPHFVAPDGSFSGHNAALYRGTGTAVLYGDPSTIIQIVASDTSGPDAVSRCTFSVTGYSVKL